MWKQPKINKIQQHISHYPDYFKINDFLCCDNVWIAFFMFIRSIASVHPHLTICLISIDSHVAIACRSEETHIENERNAEKEREKHELYPIIYVITSLWLETDALFEINSKTASLRWIDRYWTEFCSKPQILSQLTTLLLFTHFIL